MVQGTEQGTDLDGSWIKQVSEHEGEHAQSPGGLRSALRELSVDTHELRSLLDEQTSKVEELSVELQTARQLLDDGEANVERKISR